MTSAEVLDFLLQAGVDINSRGVDTTTACHFAACRGDFKVDMLEFLLARGADPNVRDGLRGRTPCHRAVEYHRGSRIALHMIPLLLEHGGDFEITDDYGVTPIETAFYDIMFDVVLRLAALVPAAVARTRMPPFDRDDDFRRITAVQLAVGCPYDDLNQHHRHVRAHLSHQVDLYRASIVADRKCKVDVCYACIFRRCCFAPARLASPRHASCARRSLLLLLRSRRHLVQVCGRRDGEALPSCPMVA